MRKLLLEVVPMSKNELVLAGVYVLGVAVVGVAYKLYLLHLS
jgi:hypothetical protein